MPGHYRNKALLRSHYRDNILALGCLLCTQETVAAGCYGDKPLTQVLEVHSVAGADCPTSVAFKGQNLYNFPLPMQPEIREHLLPNLEGFATNCLSTAGCTSCAIGMAASALERWIGLGPNSKQAPQGWGSTTGKGEVEQVQFLPLQ